MTLEDQVDEKITNGILEFSIDLMKRLYQEAEENNVIFSPLSISVAISLAYLGTAENTNCHKEIGSILRNASAEESETTNKLPAKEFHENIRKLLESIISENRTEHEYDATVVRVANGIFMQEGAEMNSSYMYQAKAQYKIEEIANLNFEKDGAAAIQKLNEWISQKTDGHISEFYRKQLDPCTLMIMAITLYFKGRWNERFSSTKIEKFSTGKEEIMVPMMHHIEHASYVNKEFLQFEAIGLPYIVNDTSHHASIYEMIIILPYPKQTPINVINNLKAEHIKEILGAPDSVVDYKIPQFQFFSAFLLKDALAKLGMREAFEESCTLTELLKGRSGGIREVHHAALVKVDGERAKVDPAVAVQVASDCAGIDENSAIPFCANRPFMALVCHRPTSSILFSALVQKPEVGISPESCYLSITFM